jgi:peptide/nickel transport system substrate-binding protein
MSKITRREFLRVSAITLGGAVLTACGTGATTEAPMDETTGGETTTEEEVLKALPERPTTWPLGDVPRNATLKYYWSSAPAAGVFNAFAGGYNHQNGNAVLYEPCSFFSAHGNATYMWLAESAEPNDTATEWTINFRKGIKWSDGTPFTAEDVAWSMETLKRVEGLARSGTYKAELESATAVDDTTLKVVLNQPDWRFFFKSLTFRFDLGDDTAVMPKHVFSQIADEEIATTVYWDLEKGWPISTGPYGVSASTEQFTNYDLRPSWWAVETGLVEKEPAPWRIEQTLFTNDTNAAQLLINKEIDQALDIRPLVCASVLAQAGDYIETWTKNAPPFGYMDWWPISVQFCTEKPPFDNPKVRWAVAYALDQQKVVDIGWGGAGLVANAPFPGFPPLNAYMDGIKDITDQYNVLEYNLEKSAALMEEAGFTKNADGWWAFEDGSPIDGDLYAAVPLFGDIAPVVAEQLRSAGFKCEHKVPPDVWAAKVDGRASMFLFGHGGATIDPYDTFMLYVKANAAPMGEQSWGNITRWDDPEFATLRDEMNNTAMDDPKMQDIFKQMMAIWYEQLPDCPLVQWFHRIPVNKWYFTNWPNVENPVMNSALWHLTMLQVVLQLQATGNA